MILEKKGLLSSLRMSYWMQLRVANLMNLPSGYSGQQ